MKRRYLMRKFNHEVNRKGRKYTNELRQAVANKVDFYLNTTTLSSMAIWERVSKEFDVCWMSARNYHNALGNAPSARGRKRNPTNIEPIAKGRYPSNVRKIIMEAAMKENVSVYRLSKLLGISNSTIYDWLKAYGYSTAYFNK
ncbi:helix-turn-helix domain containing protein [bacterium]|nr:helix-turn-helix domain containing protein [bacterium]